MNSINLPTPQGHGIFSLPEDLLPRKIIYDYLNPQEALPFLLLCKETSRYAKQYLLDRFQEISEKQRLHACLFHIPRILPFEKNSQKLFHLFLEKTNKNIFYKTLLSVATQGNAYITQAIFNSNRIEDTPPIDLGIALCESLSRKKNLVARKILHSNQSIESQQLGKALQLAIQNHNDLIAEAILELGQPIDPKELGSALAISIEKKNDWIALKILNAKRDIKELGKALQKAIEVDHPEMVSKILTCSRTIDPLELGHALYYAMKSNQDRALQIFHSNRTIDSDYRFLAAVQLNDPQLAEEIFHAHLSIAPCILNEALQISIEKNYYPLAQKILHSNLSITTNEFNYAGSNLKELRLEKMLCIAIEKNRDEIAIEMIQSRRLSRSDYSLEHAFFLAVVSDKILIVQEMIHSEHLKSKNSIQNLSGILKVAIQENKTRIAEEIIDSHLFIPPKELYEIFKLAIEKGQNEIISKIISSPRPFYLSINELNEPFSIAMTNNQDWAAENILNHIKKKGLFVPLPFLSVANENGKDLLGALILKDWTKEKLPNESLELLLIEALEKKNHHIVQSLFYLCDSNLLSSHLNLEKILRIAIEKNDLTMATIILNSGWTKAPFDLRNCFQFALKSQNIPIAQIILNIKMESGDSSSGFNGAKKTEI